MLRVYGYYDALVFRSVGGIQPGEESAARAPTRASRRCASTSSPGTQYRFGAIDLGELAAAGADYRMLRDSFEIVSRRPAAAGQDRRGALRPRHARSARCGYPFAAIDEPELLVDHARDEGDLTMPVTPGGKYRFGDGHQQHARVPLERASRRHRPVRSRRPLPAQPRARLAPRDPRRPGWSRSVTLHSASKSPRRPTTSRARSTSRWR